MTINDTLVASEAPVDAVTRRKLVPEWATLLVVLAGNFMITLDFFIVNVAIPSTQRDLDATAGEIQWIVAGYALAIAAGVITAGRLGDLFGRRRMYALGLALFTIASLACGMSQSAGELVGARIIQGAAAALLTPQVLAIITTAFTGKALGKAFTAYGFSMGIAAVFGQLIGGVLINADIAGLGWRSCFLINLPIGVIVLVLVPRVIPRSPGTGTERLDLVGMAIITLALVATVLPLIQGQAQGWPLWTVGSFALAIVLFGAFIVYVRSLSRRGGEPLIDPALFGSRGFRVGIATQFVFWTGQGSYFLFFALYLQQGRGLTALGAGVVFSAIGGGYLVTSINAGRIAARLGRSTVAIGTLMMAAGLIAMQVAVREISTTGSIWWLVPGLIIDGAGMGIALSPLASTVLSHVPTKFAGAGSGVLSTTMQVASAVGIAVIGIVFYRHLGAPATFPTAFSHGLTMLTIIEVATAAMTVLLPKPGR